MALLPESSVGLAGIVRALLRVVSSLIVFPPDKRDAASAPVASLVAVLTVTSGIVLFAIGFFQLAGMPFTPTPRLTVLAQPTGYDPFVDRVFAVAFVVCGSLLTLSFFPRQVAAVSLVLVIARIALVRGGPETVPVVAAAIIVALTFIWLLKRL